MASEFLIVVLMYISLITNEVEHFHVFIGFFFLTHLLLSFGHFLVWGMCFFLSDLQGFFIFFFLEANIVGHMLADAFSQFEGCLFILVVFWQSEVITVVDFIDFFPLWFSLWV